MYRKILAHIHHHTRLDARYFLTGGFWLFTAQISTLFFSLITTVIFAHKLSESAFGTYRYIIDIGILIASFSLTGAGQAILQASARNIVGIYIYLTKQTLYYSFGIFLIGITGSIYYFIRDDMTLTIGLACIAIFQPFSSLFTHTLSFIQGKKEFKTSAHFQIIKAIFVSCISVITIFLTHNIAILLTTYFVSQALYGIVGYFYYQSKDVNQSRLHRDTEKKYLSFAQHTSTRNGIMTATSKIDSLIIFQQLGASSLAIFSIATILPNQVRGTSKNLLTLLIPKYTARETSVQHLRSIRYRSVQFFLILCGLSVTFILCAPFIFPLLFPKYEHAIFYTQLMALSFPASALLIPLSELQVRHAEKSLYHIHLHTSIAQLILALLFTLTLGILGAIIARILTAYIQCISTFYYLFYRKN